METKIKYYPVRFFLITYLITWSTWFIAAWFSHQPGMEGLQLLFMIPGLFAPFIAALAMILGRKNKGLWKDFIDRLSLKRIKAGTLPVILLVMPFALFLATAISLLFGRSAQQFQLAGEFQIMDGEVLISLVILFLAPTLEELGWRGYGVDSLRSKSSLIKTTLIFAVLWAFWHLPLFFIKGYYHNELWNTSIIYVINFFISILPATILMNWMYYKNNRCITASILFHFMMNLFSVLFLTEQFTKCIITVILLVISIIVIAAERKLFFGKPGDEALQ